MSEVKLKIDGNKGFFYIDVDGKQEAMMTFVFAGDKQIIIDHTEVNPGNEGKGYGKQMVTKAVEYAREIILKSFHFVRLQKVFLIKFQSLKTYYNNN